jgi:hypothetical protein
MSSKCNIKKTNSVSRTGAAFAVVTIPTCSVPVCKTTSTIAFALRKQEKGLFLFLPVCYRKKINKQRGEHKFSCLIEAIDFEANELMGKK